MLLSLVVLAATLSAEPAAPASPIDAGLKAFARHRYAQAEVEFRKAVDADANSASAHFYLGYTYYKMGEPTLRLDANKLKARDEFAKAFELDPAFTPAWSRGPAKK
jgi:Flp pilus assembly protein TadD